MKKDFPPVDYIIGWVPFLNCRIDLRYRPMIPRPETEYWTEKAIDEIKNNSPRARRGADVFAGSGAVGLAILKSVKKVKVDFYEIDKKLIEQIRLNLKLNRISPSRYRIFNADIFGNKKIKYDFILANPPYIAKSRIDKVQKSVLKYEPHLALFGGAQGLFFIKKFLKSAKSRLNPDGLIFMEFDSFQKKPIEKMLKQYKYRNWQFLKDQFNRWRCLMVKNLL